MQTSGAGPDTSVARFQVVLALADGSAPRRHVGARIIACGRVSSAQMVSSTGTVFALANPRPRWMLE